MQLDCFLYKKYISIVHLCHHESIKFRNKKTNILRLNNSFKTYNYRKPLHWLSNIQPSSLLPLMIGLITIIRECLQLLPVHGALDGHIETVLFEVGVRSISASISLTTFAFTHSFYQFCQQVIIKQKRERNIDFSLRISSKKFPSG